MIHRACASHYAAFVRKLAAVAIVCGGLSTSLFAQAGSAPARSATPVAETPLFEAPSDLATDARGDRVLLDPALVLALETGERSDLRLVVSEDRWFDATIERRETLPSGNRLLVGRLDNVDHGRIFIVVGSEVLVGAIHAVEQGDFSFETIADGAAVFSPRPAPSGEQPSCGVNTLVPPEEPSAERGVSPCPWWKSALAGYVADDGSMIDLMVVYTAAARDAAGGVPQIEAKIDLAVSIANQAYIDSDVDTSIRVIRKALIGYTETGDYNLDLPRLVNIDDGFLDSVHTDRDTYGADLVSLWVSSLNTGGAAYQLFDLAPNDDGRYGFSVMRQDNAGFETLAHEVGHNFGCQHDRPNAAGVGFYPFSYGYREPGAVWKTIMAYPPGTTIYYFSNPNLTYTGPLGNPGAMGVPGEDPATSCDCARAHNLNAFTLANFRPSTVSPAPPARLYVDDSAAPGGNGHSWGTAFDDLQDAIGLAVQSRGAVDEIWVANGVYLPDLGTGDRDFHFRLIDDVTIYGGFVGTETLLSQRDPQPFGTTLSGDIGTPLDPNDNSYHVVDGTGKTATAVIDGCTIADGRADGEHPNGTGGGLRVLCGGPIIRGCFVIGNYAEYGGGTSNFHGSTTLYESTLFSANAANFGAGAMYNYDLSAVSVVDCTFDSNYSLGSEGAVQNNFTSDAEFVGGLFSYNFAVWAGAVGNYSSSPSFSGVTFAGNSATFGGGAISSGNTSVPSIADCTFEYNNASFGGAIYYYDTLYAPIDRTNFISNSADTGGAVYHWNSSPVYIDCLFEFNQAGGKGYGAGGAVANASASFPEFGRATFVQNWAGCCGGATASFDASVPYLYQCEFDRNEANYGGGMWVASGSGDYVLDTLFVQNHAFTGGGAAHVTDASSPIFVNSVFTGNEASGYGGGAFLNYAPATPWIVNSTLANNTAGWQGGGIFDDDTSSQVTNSIFWNNSDINGLTESAQILRFLGAATVVNYSTLQGWSGAMGGLGNNGLDPLFVDPDGADNIPGTVDDDLRLALASPLIDSGDNGGIPGGIVVDFDGGPRFYDMVASADSGSGTQPIIDRGAFEVSPACPEDLNGDGIVSAQDLAFLLSAFNKCQGQAGYSPSVDLDGSGCVGAQDLALLLSQFLSTCP